MIKKKTIKKRTKQERVTIKRQGGDWYTVNIGGQPVAWARGKEEAKIKQNEFRGELTY